MNRSFFASVVLSFAGLGIIATSPSESGVGSRRATEIRGEFVLPSGALSQEMTVTTRVVGIGSATVSGANMAISFSAPLGVGVTIAPPEGSDPPGMVASTSLTRCDNLSCQATFRARWTRVGAATESLPVRWTAMLSFSVSSGMLADGARLEATVVP